MTEVETISGGGLHGKFRDVMVDGEGRVILETGWQKNAIVEDCHRLLIGFLRGAPTTTLGIQGLQVGAGLPIWDLTTTPAPSTTQTALVDPNPHTVPLASLTFNYLAAGTPTGTPTNLLEIVATLGPNVPPWPDIPSGHPTGTLREFGLVARLNGTNVLINYRTHAAIAKHPLSTLTRTIWLEF
jgi:hypothetical protein